MMEEYQIRRIVESDSFVIADGFTTRREAKEYGEQLSITVYGTLDDARGKFDGAFIHKVYHDS